MDCPQTGWPSNSEYLADFRRRTYRERTPVAGGINLTDRCNLKCVHCYIRNLQGMDAHAQQLPTDRILQVIDDAATAGCLYFLITGGEPLLHPDFPRIYEHARRKGMLVAVFTNGTLLTDIHADLFEALPPYQIEITLYGGTEETFDRVAGVHGAYQACHQGIDLLVSRGLPFRLKTMLLTLNQHEFEIMRGFAKRLDVTFRFDPLVGPKLDGDLSPLQYRIDPKEAVAIEMSDPQRARRMARYAGEVRKPSRQEYLYRCGTGTTSFFISASGRLQPCLMATEPSVDLRVNSFAKAWQMLAQVRNIKARPDSPCRVCGDLPYCGYCPPVMELESGMQVHTDCFMCQLGGERHRAALHYRE